MQGGANFDTTPVSGYFPEVLLRSSRPLATTALLTLLAGSWGCPSKPSTQDKPPAPPPRADLVLLGGVVHTLDPALPVATAVAVDKGRIVYVGDDAGAQPWVGTDTRKLALAGRVVTPGLHDAHMHFAGLGLRRAALDLVGTRSIAEIKGKVAEAVAKAPTGSWIVGRGWDQNDWKGRRKRLPTAFDLDSVSKKHPVVLTRVDGHAIWVNSAAMKVAGITRRTRAPAGGRIMQSRRQATGVFIDNAMELIRKHVPAPTQEGLRSAYLLAQKECLGAGLTTIHDMGVSPAQLAVLEQMEAAKELKIRVLAYHDGTVADLAKALEAGPKVANPDSDERLTVRGVKFVADGALGSRGAALFEPYSDDRRNKGLLLVEPAVFEAKVQTVVQAGFQPATHAIGDRANAMVLDVYERVVGADADSVRPRLEHAQVLRTQDIRRFEELGVIASMQPTHATSDMPWAEKRLGKDRMEGAYAWQSLLTTGATVAAGSDAPVEDISVVLGLYAATTRKDMFGFPEEGWRASEKMKPHQALHAFTRSAAYAGFMDKDSGMVKKGMLADLTVLDKDPLRSGEDEMATTQVLLTVVGGNIEYEREDAFVEVQTSSTATVTAP